MYLNDWIFLVNTPFIKQQLFAKGRVGYPPNIVLHFAQFCTLHNFQTDLVNFWTDFQSCYGDGDNVAVVTILK